MQESSLKPAAPIAADMLGATVLFRHENGWLFPGLHEGVVTDYQEDTRGDGWLTVKSPSFNISKKVHEKYVKGWLRPAQIPAQTAEIEKTAAA